MPPLSQLIAYLTVFLISLLAIGLSGKPLIQLLKKIGFVQFIRQEGPASHQSKQSTPTAGGIAFLLALLIVPLCLYVYSQFSKTSINWAKCYIPFVVLLASAAIGFWDDYSKKVKKQNEGLKPREKLLAQVLVTLFLFFSLGRHSSNFFGFEFELAPLLFLVFIFVVLAGSMNAANLTDGLDGLASSVLGWSYLGIGTYLMLLNGTAIESITWAFALAGICFGFLFINGHPAKAFMGDTGSFFLGGGLASLALVNKLEWYLLIFMLLPIWETLSVIIQVACCKLSKKFLGRDLRPFRMTPFHHHLELSGWSEKKIVFWLSSIQGLVNVAFIICLFVLKK
jgi:phospho-N-acetylmuramoyl-pentapeptide-transferase